MQGEWLKQPVKRGGVVLFVHGFLSSGMKCWMNKNGTYWPALVAEAPGLESFGVYVFTYRTDVFSGSYSLSDAVDALKEHCRLDRVLDNGNPLIFVCHSMGGIVVRRFMVQQQLDLIRRKMMVGLFLVASPSLGSEYANWLCPIAELFGNTQASALRFCQDNVWLNDLDRDFIGLKESRELRLLGKELVEDRFIVLTKFLKEQVVPPFSGARYFSDSYKVPGSDHFSISAPASARDTQHRLLLNFISDVAIAFEAERSTETNSPSLESLGALTSRTPVRDYPALSINVISPGSTCTIQGLRDRGNDVSARVMDEGIRRGVPPIEWIAEALQPLKTRLKQAHEALARDIRPEDLEREWILRRHDVVETEIEQYALKLKDWYRSLVFCLTVEHEKRTKMARAFLFNIEILNDGRAPAEKVTVELTFPDKMLLDEWVSDYSLGVSEPPQPPPELATQSRTEHSAREVGSSDWYEMNTKTASGDLTYWLSDSKRQPRKKVLVAAISALEHGSTRRLRSILVSFGYERAEKLVIPYRLHASNQPKDTVGELTVDVRD